MSIINYQLSVIRFTSILSLLLIFACTNPPQKLLTARHFSSPELLHNKVTQNNFDFDYLLIRSKANINLGNQNMATHLQTRIKKDSVIWVSVSPFIGIEAVRLILTRDSILLLNKIENFLYKLNYDSLSLYSNYPLNFNFIQSIMLGNIPSEWSNFSSISVDSSGYHSAIKDKNANILCQIHPEFVKLYSIIAHQIKTGDSLKVYYDDYQDIDSSLVPMKSNVILKHKKEKTEISVTHLKFEKSVQPLTFPFSRP